MQYFTADENKFKKKQERTTGTAAGRLTADSQQLMTTL